ncbi:hypothetical protein [Paraburkholderia sp. 32]|uniref:hypothetical protein n=1 Tax=Paraburkholderia sp. 32 TaxID=2991057 RepID=UPI003D208EEA
MFNDKAKSTAEKRPSVDRAKLRGHDPHAAKTEPTQGIVGLVTEAVRNISGVTRTDTSGNVVTEHAVDVIYDPREDNNAHALVTVAPVFESNRPFERLKDSLARLAEKGGWLVEPGGGD